MAGALVIPNIFNPATVVTTPDLDEDFSTVEGYVNDPTNRITTGTDSGTANTYVITPSPPVADLTAKFIIWFIVTDSNTGDSTAAVSGLDPKHIYFDSPTGPALLVGGEMIAHNLVGLFFDPALNSSAGGYHLVNGIPSIIIDQ